MEGMRGTLGILETRRSLRHTILLPGQQGTKSCFSAPQPPDRFCTQRSAHQAWGVSERPVLLGVRGPGPYLHGSGGSRAAGPDLEQAGAGGGRLPTLAGGAAPVDDHGFPAKQAHEVSGLLALDHTALRETGAQVRKGGWEHRPMRTHWAQLRAAGMAQAHPQTSPSCSGLCVEWGWPGNRRCRKAGDSPAG